MERPRSIVIVGAGMAGATAAVTLRELGSDIRQLHKDDIAELLRRMLCDADDGNVSIELKPFVLLGIFQQRLLQVSGGLAAFVLWHNEWERRYGDRQALAAQLGEDCCAGHRMRGWKIAHCDRGVEARAEAA